MENQPIDFKRLTLRAHKVLQLALRRALASDKDCIASEHLLAGLLEEGSGLAVTLLKSLGVDIGRLSEQLSNYVAQGDPDQLVHRRLPLAEDSQQTLRLSLDEARLMGSMFVGTEHLLLGLLRHTDGLGGELLQQSGLIADQVRQRLQEMVKENGMHKGPEILLSVEAKPESPPEVERTAGTDGLEGFTARAVQAVNAAREEAQRCGRYHVGTDHLLLGILADGRSAAVKTLRKYVDDMEKLKEDLRDLSRLV